MALINGKRLSDGTAAPSRRASTSQAAPRALPRPRQQASQTQRPLRAVQVVPERRNLIANREPLPDLTSLFKRKPAAVEQTERPYAGFDSMWYTPEQRELTEIPESRPKPEVWPWRPDTPPVYLPDSQKVREAERAAERRISRSANSPLVRRGRTEMETRLVESQQANARARREASDRPEAEYILTPEEWAAYTPMQQAAAQANADLAQAIARDSDPQIMDRATPAQMRGYQDRVEWLFGKDASTGFKGIQYAPNTIAFLDERDIGPVQLAGKTLDDFISGDVLMSKVSIDHMKEETSSRKGRLSLAKVLAQGQLAYQEKLADTLQEGDRLIADITGRSTSEAANRKFGVDMPQSGFEMGKVRPEMAEAFDKYVQGLARADIPIEAAIEAVDYDLRQYGSTPEEAEQMWEGLRESARQALIGGGEWFPGVDFPTRSPAEVAEALGAQTLKRQSFSSVEGW